MIPVSTATPTAGMHHIEGTTFAMGSDRHYPEEAPVRPVSVDAFWIDVYPVTNREFARFVAATGHVTTAQIAPDPALYAGMPPELAYPGSLVFRRTKGRVDLNVPSNWWEFCIGADWQHPLGPGSTLTGFEDHPVVHVTAVDAEAYATWAGKQLPTEAQWELAARGGLEGADYAWGAQLAPDGAMLANYWQGNFPWQNTLADGFERTSPVGSYPPNGFGLYDMIGNVWELTADWYAVRDARQAGKSCCVPRNPRGGPEQDSYDPATPALRIGRRVIKGGSHLCAESYCRRYRPAARHPQAMDTSTSHVGFRCVKGS